MLPSAQPDDRSGDRTDDRGDDRGDSRSGYRSSSVEGRDTIGDLFHGGRALDEKELDSALQLLVERAQYITGATGTALALPEGGEMVCRASAGSSAPAVGARLQVGSGLTAESIARRQLLRCNNAESDPRVNLEACRALGIASIVVLPLLRRNGEVRGLFELFSDHPYAFEERDLIALERMADLTLTALDLAEQAPSQPTNQLPNKAQSQAPNSAPAAQRKPSRPAESSPESFSENESEGPSENLPESLPESLLESLRELSEASSALSTARGSELAPEPVSEQSEIPSSAVAPPGAVVVPEAMLRLQKCESCGFPVSEGRTLCLDCERKKPDERKPGEEAQGTPSASMSAVSPTLSSSLLSSALSSALPPQDEFVPAFLVKSAAQRGSWLSNHINLLAIVVLLLGILVAVVLFR